MTDIQNAKFLSIVDGKGEFLVSAPKNPSKFVDCTNDKLSAKKVSLRIANFTYPLQSWEGTYTLYEKKKVVLDNHEQMVIKIIKDFSKVTRYKDVIEKSIKTIYYRSNFIDSTLPKGSMIIDSSVWSLIFNSARMFICNNRSKEIKLFDKIYKDYMPRDCFVNLYERNVISAIAPHSDHVSFCTVVLCLLNEIASDADNLVGGNLVLLDENGQEQVMPLSSHDIIVFARINHYVQSEARKTNRITINAFF